MHTWKSHTYIDDIETRIEVDYLYTPGEPPEHAWDHRYPGSDPSIEIMEMRANDDLCGVLEIDESDVDDIDGIIARVIEDHEEYDPTND